MKILSTKTILSSKYFTVSKKTIERNGKIFTKDFIERNPVVLIVPYTAENEIYMELQFRDSLNRQLLEVVAGTIEANDDPFATAKRELQEEAGLRAKEWKKIAEWQLSSNMSAPIHVFAATGLEHVERKLESDEEISIQKMPLAAVLQKIETGKMEAASHIATILLFERLRREGKL